MFLVTVNKADTAEHPELFVTVTVNDPELFAKIFCVIAPFDHK